MSQITERADTIARFLKDDAVQDAFQQVKDDAYAAFLKASTENEMRAAHALAQAVERLETAFRVMVSAGERERLDEQIAERQLATRRTS